MLLSPTREKTHDLREDELEIKIEPGARPMMKWRGTSNALDPSRVIDPFIDRFLKELQVRAIEIDFRELEYMNSSAVTPIIRLIRELDAKKIRTPVIYKRISKWQQASFKALETLSNKKPANIKVEGR